MDLQLWNKQAQAAAFNTVIPDYHKLDHIGT